MRDIMGLMKQAQAMQQKLQDAQAELETIEVDGTSGGGVVTVKVTGKGALEGDQHRSFADEPGREGDPRGSDRRGHERRRGQSRRAAQDRMADLTKGLPLPPGLKLF